MSELPASADRETYRPSGRVFLPVFLVLVAVAFVVAMGCAALIMLTGKIGMRLVLITPLVLTLPAAGMLYLAVRHGKCRNRVLAFLAGVVVGAAVSPGRFHAEIVDVVGWDALPHIEFLPRFLEVRMSFKTIGKVGAANAGGPQPAGTVDKIFNWVLFSLEVGVIVIGCGLFAAGVAGQPFDEAHKKWMITKNIVLPSGASEGLRDALDTGNIEKLAEQLDLLGQPTVANCTVSIQYVPETLAEGEQSLAYLSCLEIAAANSEGSRPGWTTIKCWKLTPEEVRRIAPILSVK
jgi:hypothetical protein